MGLLPFLLGLVVLLLLLLLVLAVLAVLLLLAAVGGGYNLCVVCEGVWESVFDEERRRSMREPSSCSIAREVRRTGERTRTISLFPHTFTPCPSTTTTGPGGADGPHLCGRAGSHGEWPS